MNKKNKSSYKKKYNYGLIGILYPKGVLRKAPLPPRLPGAVFPSGSTLPRWDVGMWVSSLFFVHRLYQIVHIFMHLFSLSGLSSKLLHLRTHRAT